MKILLVLLSKGGITKLLTTGGTMILSVGAYALLFGWPYAVGLVLLIFVHELGHYIAARQCQLEVGAPVFIPFVGAWIQLKEARMEPAVEAHVAIAGPMLGSGAALVLYLYALSSGDRLSYALAQAGFLINLFNLIPLHPLDGGRLVGVISPRLWLVGAPLLIAVFFWHPSPLLLLIAIIAFPQLWLAIKGKSDQPTLETAREKMRYGGMYLSPTVSLAVLAFQAHQFLNG